VIFFIEVSGMKITDKKNRMRYRKGDVAIVDWLLAIDLDLGQANRRLR
jgi:hypothetical protein